MRRILPLLVLALVFTGIHAQNSNWSALVDLGFANANDNFSSEDYSASDMSNLTASLGVRYMFDSRNYYVKSFGLMLKGGFTNFNGDSSSEDFQTTMYNVDLYGVVDIQNAFKIRDRNWPQNFKLYVNGGVGVGHYQLDDSSPFANVDDGYILDGDQFYTVNFGITPEYSISRKLSVYLDLTYSRFGKNDFSLDGNSNVDQADISSFEPSMLRVSFGVSYYFLDY